VEDTTLAETTAAVMVKTTTITITHNCLTDHTATHTPHHLMGIATHHRRDPQEDQGEVVVVAVVVEAVVVEAEVAAVEDPQVMEVMVLLHRLILKE
jgi:hypothetical protein